MQNRIKRSNNNKMLGGVAGGLGNYFNIDPVIFRALFIIAVLGWGTGFLLYIILWIIIPEEKYEDKFVYDKEKGKYVYEAETKQVYAENDVQEKSNKGKLFGALLIALGMIILLTRFLPEIGLQTIFPILLMLTGILILVKPYFWFGGVHESK
jgi:phage shock protein PspC (stress-responsive transcriptional regulator)